VLVGLVGGFTFFVAQIYWISQYLGPVPLIALAGLQAVIFAVFAGVMALVSQANRVVVAEAAGVAILWVGREYVSTHWPYGGFPWSRVAMSQANSPLASWVSIGGFGLLSFLLVFLSLWVALSLSKKARSQSLISSAASFGTVFMAVGIAAIPVANSGTMDIAGVQGNANAGLFANTSRGEILLNHLDATERLLEQKTRPDLVVWPENASDINPDDDVDVRLTMENLVNDKLQTPFIFGTITSEGDEIFNSSKLWLPGRGEVDQYDKKRPVPFGEYVPDRDFFYALSPDLVGMISRGYSFGNRDGIFNVGPTDVGVLICFEEAIDELPREIVLQGASVLVAQTNNADFGRSDESVQQNAIARLRAIETGRSLVSVSTVGPSVIFDPKGKILASTRAYESAVLRAEVPLSNELTIAMRGGWLFDPACAAGSALISVLVVVERRRKTTKL
jgi:apolipoprotein N-acyltransferase